MDHGNKGRHGSGKVCFMIVLHQVKLGIKDNKDILKKKCASLLGVDPERIVSLKILRESLDARKKPDLIFSYEAGLVLAGLNDIRNEERFLKKLKKTDAEAEDIIDFEFPYHAPDSFERPLIVGFGPAGIFCAYLLAASGFKPIVLERGRAIEDRQKDVLAFWKTGILNTESNVQFGEGGAGTFSDGKLNTAVKGSKNLQRFVLDTFVKFGAPEDITYSYKPHIGTDKLSEIIPKMREYITEKGGEVRFESRVDGLITEGGRIKGVIVKKGDFAEEILSGNVCLAIGHSARDTFRMLCGSGIEMSFKPFAVGVRCEHDQIFIDRSQYGVDNLNELGAAPYKLTAKTRGGRGVYTFCMCPGGYIVDASSEENRLCVNGMSYRDRASGKANSAVVVAVGEEDIEGEDPLKGLFWLERLEEAAYKVSNGLIPVQRLDDFKTGNISCKEGIAPRIMGRWTCEDIGSFLPGFVKKGIEDGFTEFGKKIKGFDAPDTLLIGFEGRTSSPVRISRTDEFNAIGIEGLYPCGEGAGYAGGITSAAVDGCKVAMQIAKNILSNSKGN